MNDPAAPLARSSSPQSRHETRPADAAAPDAGRPVEDFEQAIRRAGPRGPVAETAIEPVAQAWRAARPARAPGEAASRASGASDMSEAKEACATAPAICGDSLAGDPLLSALLARLGVHEAAPAPPAATDAAEPPPARVVSQAPIQMEAASSPPDRSAGSEIAPEAAKKFDASASFEAAPVGLQALATTRHLPPARLDGAAATLGAAALGARPALLEAPSLAPPTSSLRLALTPEGLGEIEVTLRLRGGRLEAAIAVDRPETAALIERIRGDLSDALRRAGYDVDPSTAIARARAVEAPAPAVRAEPGAGEGAREDGAADGRGRQGHPHDQSQAGRNAQDEERRQSWREAGHDRRARARRPDFLLGALP